MEEAMQKTPNSKSISCEKCGNYTEIKEDVWWECSCGHTAAIIRMSDRSTINYPNKIKNMIKNLEGSCIVP